MKRSGGRPTSFAEMGSASGGGKTCALKFCWLAVAALVGCANYQAPTLDPSELSYRARAAVGGAIHVATAILSDDEAREITGVDLQDRWMQMLWLEVTNRDEVPYWLLFPSVDPEYFSADEVAYAFHHKLNARGVRALARHLRRLTFKNPVYPGETRSGFVFVHRDEGAKEVNLQLLSVGRFEEFTFYHELPGLRAKTFQGAENIYAPEDFRDVEEDDLRYALQYLPCCTTDRHDEGEGDPLNLIVIGNASDLFPAFVRRGWQLAEETYLSSVWKTINSFLFGQQYRYSPVSPLYAFGRSQDVALQKARGTVHQRNHLRLWLTPLRYQGKAIWVGQISRDIGVRFTLKSGTGVTHKIDPDVDETRNAIVQDILFSKGLVRIGFVRGVGPATPSAPHKNLTGDPYFTDGMRSVLLLDQGIYPLRDLKFFDWERPGDREFRPAGEDAPQAP